MNQTFLKRVIQKNSFDGTSIIQKQNLAKNNKCDGR